MGRGMRRFVSNWYLNQDPYDLALEVFRIKSRHKWSHADMIKLARVRTEDVAISAVLKAVRGLGAAQEEFKDKPEAQPILEYMACVKDINRCAEPGGLLSDPGSSVLEKVLQSIKDPLALAASKLQPAEILTVLAQVESAWEHPPTKAHKAKVGAGEAEGIPAPHESLITGLQKMMVSALSNVPKVPCSVVVCVDCRPTITEGCSEPHLLPHKHRYPTSQ